MKPILTLLFSLLLVCPGFAKDKKPNVVVLLADDLGSQDIGCYGGPVKTPALDRLAADGIRFETCTTSTKRGSPNLKRAGSAVFNCMTSRRILVSKTTLRKSAPNSSPD